MVNITNFIKKYKSAPEELKASLAYTICSIAQRSISLITMPLFTRLLTPTQYGQFTVYQSWLNLLNIAITLNMAYGSFSTAMIKFEKDRSGYIAAIQNLTVALAAVFLLIYFPFRNLFNQLFELPTPMVLIMIAEIVMQFALMCWCGVKRFEFQYKKVVLVTILIAVLGPLITYFLVINSQEKGYVRIAGIAGTTIFAGLICFLYEFIAGKGGRNKEYWKYALSFNIPLIPYYASQVVFNQSDRIMISHICGTDKASMYGIAYTLATLLVFVLNAVNSSYVPWLYQKIKDNHAEENRGMANGIALLMAFLLMGVIALAPEIIGILAAPEYIEAIWVVPPVAASILLLFYAQLFINIQFYFEEKSRLVWASIGAAVINVILNALLIPTLGYIAAGYTTLVSYGVFVYSNYVEMKKAAAKRGFSTKCFNLPMLLLIFGGFSALAVIATILYPYPWIRFAIILAVFAAMGIAHKKIGAFIRYIMCIK